MKTIIQRINDLANYVDNKNGNRDVVFDVIFKLRQSHEDACKGEYAKPDLHDLIFSTNDCLATEGANDLPEEMLGEIRSLQLEIVDIYGLQD
ncbi:MAG: hypothetical protein ABSB19_13885 [Methylomonas sp.]|jgi:hypothetical protein